MSGPLILHFVLGFLETCIVQVFPISYINPLSSLLLARHDTTKGLTFRLHTCNTLLVDIFQDKPSAAAASGNIVRCGLSAAGIATMEPLMQRMGLGWYFTLLSVLGAVVGLASCEVIKRKGMDWRLARDDPPSVQAGPP